MVKINYTQVIIYLVMGMTGICFAAAGGTSISLPFTWINAGVLLCALFISLALIAFFAGSETAIVSANKERIDSLSAKGNVNARIIQRLLSTPDTMLTVVLVGTNLMTTIAGQSGIILTGYAFPGQENVQKVVNTFIMTGIILVFCEILPKIIYRVKADSLALSSATGIRISSILLSPLVFFITRLTSFFIPKRGNIDQDNEKVRAMRDELLLLATMGSNEAEISADQLKMMHNVLNLESRPVEKVMVPLIEIVAIAHTATIKELFEKVEETGFTRICIYENRFDNMIGYVNFLEVLQSETDDTSIGPFIRKNTCFEPESKHVIALLSQLHKNKCKLAFIIDEYGGITGMITMEDLVEEILGEIREDNIKDDSQHIHRISETVFECDGGIALRELISFGIPDLPAGDYETIGGYLEFALQKVPKPGEIVETDRLTIVILESTSKKVNKVRISLKFQPKE